MNKSLFFATIFAVFSVVISSSCSKPEVTSNSFSTQDATIVSNIAYISEFTVKCGSGDIGSIYAELDGNVVPVSVVGPNRYQVRKFLLLVAVHISENHRSIIIYIFLNHVYMVINYF